MENTKCNEHFITLEYNKNTNLPDKYKIEIFLNNIKLLFTKSYKCSSYKLEDVIKIRDKKLKQLIKQYSINIIELFNDNDLSKFPKLPE